MLANVRTAELLMYNTLTIQYLGHSPIYWETFVVNATIPLYRAEAEYVAAHVAGKEIMATTHLLIELKLPPV